MTERVEIRAERCEETLGRRWSRYHVVAFNPPFPPMPDGLEAPAFARGSARRAQAIAACCSSSLIDISLPQGTAYMVANLLGTAAGPFLHRGAAPARRPARPGDRRLYRSIAQLTAWCPRRLRALGAPSCTARTRRSPRRSASAGWRSSSESTRRHHARNTPRSWIVRAVRDVQGARLRCAWRAGRWARRPDVQAHRCE